MTDPFPKHLPRKLKPEVVAGSTRFDAYASTIPAPAPVVPAQSTPQKVDPTYLAYVRRQPCCAPSQTPCGGRMEAHHYPAKGRAKQGDDRRVTALSTAHHRMWHDTGALPPFDALQTHELFLQEQLRLLLAYLDGCGS